MVLLRMRLVQIKMRRTKRGSADPGRETRARSTIIGVGNNVGIGVREWFFVSMTYAVWCARRDSNPHDFTHCHLKAARLPIPPRALFLGSAQDCAVPHQDRIETRSTAPM